MENVIRFMVLRAADRSAARTDAAATEGATPMQQRLAALPAGADAAAVRRVLSDFAASPQFVHSLAALHHAKPLLAAVDALGRNDRLTLDNAQRIVATAFGPVSAALVDSQAWQEDRRRLSDSLIALKYLTGDPRRPLAQTAAALRMMRLVEAIAAGGPLSERKVQALLSGPIVVAHAASWQALLRRAPAPAVTPSPQPLGVPPAATLGNRDVALALTELTAVPTAQLEVRRTKSVQTGKAASQPGASIAPAGMRGPTTRVHLTAAAVGGLSAQTRQVLTTLAIDPVRATLPEVMRELRSRRGLGLTQAVSGRGYFFEQDLARVLAGSLAEGRLFFPGVFPAWVPGAARPAVPASHGSIREAGVGDLLVVKQRLTGYETAEISHVENVLSGESKVREHRRRRSVEDVVSRETDRQTEEERDVQSTDRYELSSEAQDALAERFEVNAGLRVNARYGPMVEIEASAEVGYESTRESMRRTATEMSKEVLDRAVSRIREGVREARSTKIVDEVEEINRHALDNTGGGEHVVGVYQWLEKVYRAQVFRYDGRTIFDFNIAEPGAYLDAALRKDVAQEDGLQEAPAFVNLAGDPLSVADINEADYRVYAARFEATAAVEPPPEPFTVVSDAFTFEAGAGGEVSDIAKSKKIAIPEGYEAFHAEVIALHAGTNAFVTVGSELFVASGSLIADGRLLRAHGEAYTGSLEVGLLSQRPTVLLATVHLLCRLTPHAQEAWRLRTFAALQEAHARWTLRYNEALAARAARNGLAGNGARLSPVGQPVVRELKKACITLLTHQHFDLFDAIAFDSHGNPQLNLSVAEQQAAYARFFEQAFEWENINYVFYPYYWGRKSRWLERLLFAHPSPEVTELIQAGAARVVVAVRPGFEGAVRHFMDTGEVLAVRDAPGIGDEGYFDIADEIRVRTDPEAGDGEPVGEPWIVKVPTTLVHLRRERDLPRWNAA
jgi:hypothetical protein